MTVYNSIDACTGCTACVNACKLCAIEMRADQEGFRYPVINESICVKCGVCQSVCHLRRSKVEALSAYETKAFGVKNRNDSVRMKSSSGGVFTALSDYILQNNGSVYGAAFNNDMTVVHIRTINSGQRDRILGSKYVESDLKDIYQQVSTDLKNGLPVLFSGTPCQTSGLSSYLKVDYDNLYLIDIICHGVASPRFFADYVNDLRKHYMIKSKTNMNLTFRDKEFGWNGYNVSVQRNGKKYANSFRLQSYMKLYSASLISRPSCHVCRFASFPRTSDITIGDFWGIEKVLPEFMDEKGVSLVLINSEKGERLFCKIKDSIKFIPCAVEDSRQPQLSNPTVVSPKRRTFWTDYNEKGYKYVSKKYTGYSFKNRIFGYYRKVVRYLKTRIVG